MNVRMYRQNKDRTTIGFMTDEGGEPRGTTPYVDQLLEKGQGGSTRAERLAFYASGYSNEGWGTELVNSSS